MMGLIKTTFFALVSAFLVSLNLLAEVTCVWTGSSYECSGTGDSVIISGGGPLAPVVTNVVGVCTNCSAIPPDRLDSLAQQLDGQAITLGLLADDIMSATVDMQNVIESNNQEIATYQRFIREDGENSNTPYLFRATNYMETVSNSQSAGMQYAFDNFNSLRQYKTYAAVGAGNGIYHYANNTVLPQNGAMYDKLENVYGSAEAVKSVTNSLLNISRQLQEGAQVCQGGVGNSSTNSAPSTGDWCTYEQGEAIKDLLTELQTHLQKQKSVIDAISNYNAQTVALIRSGLYTEYNAIPRQSQLGDTWQNIYLDGNETNWGYAPTNILARIELLLYGMSGVYTNDNLFTEGDTESTEVLDNFDEVKDDATTQLRAIDTDADGREIQSLGQALISFFNKFSIQGDTASEGTELWPSSVFHVGQEEYEIPQFTPSSGAASILNQAQSFSRVACIVIYLVLGAIVVFRFWTWFASKAALMSKWVVELLTSLFAS